MPVRFNSDLLLDNPVSLQRLEGICLLFGAIAAWYILNGNWIVIIALLLATDLSALGYLANKKIGAMIYNAFHSYPIPALFLAAGLVLHIDIVVFIGLAVFAHIGADRALGFGLKFPSGFKDTHLGRIGQRRKNGYRLAK